MTIFKKSLLVLCLCVLGFSVVLAISVLAFMNFLYYEVNAAGLSSAAHTLFSVIGEGRILEYFAANAAGTGGQGVENPALPVSGNSYYRLTLIDTAGNVLWDSHVEGGLVNHIDREEVKAALEGREGSGSRNSISTGMRQMYAALPVSGADGKTIGVFRLSFTVPGFRMRISSAALPFLVFACLLALAAFGAIFAFSRSLSLSCGRLVDIAQSCSQMFQSDQIVPGTEETAAGESTPQEFLRLEKALRGMAGELNFRLEQARAEGSRLEAILNGMSEAVIALDSNLMLLLVNPRARELFSLAGDICDFSLLEASHSTELEQTAKTVLAGGRPMETELTFHSGQEQHFQVFAAPLSPANGEGAGVVLVLQDITRLVRLERVRKDFVANVSHELRTPIQLIKGFSETLLDTVEQSPKEQTIHFIEIIRKNAGIMENLTNDLLVLASLENGGGRTRETEEIPLAPLFAESVSSAEPQAKKKQTEIIVDCPAELKAKLHGSFIIQALINLIDNAIKYSPPKSKIWLGAFEEDSGACGRSLVLEVRDKGIGIPGEHLERIFERFYRVDKARSREAGGTGLGLSIVRHIALLHGGKAEVESHAGEGSVFRIRIPLSLPLHQD
ncbi:MAG: PAS domain-containing protein [Treponema sp.]|jgi:two-component system phosphate regulon sensor histidine kinase PhoR|nr:PAS domain-containing protein [Treponema sp.]